MIAFVLALAATLGPPVAVLEQRHPVVTWSQRHRRRPAPCEPFAERCVRNTIYTCTARGRWQRGPVCTSRRGRRVVCEVEDGGAAVCVESGGATPFPGDRR